MPEVRWTELWSPRDAVDARDRVGAWLPGRVVAVEKDRVKVHFKGWKAKFDEWIGDAERLVPSGSRTSSAQQAERKVAADKGRDSRATDERQAKHPATSSPDGLHRAAARPGARPAFDPAEPALIRMYKGLFPKQTAAEPQLIGKRSQSTPRTF